MHVALGGVGSKGVSRCLQDLTLPATYRRCQVDSFGPDTFVLDPEPWIAGIIDIFRYELHI